MHKGSENTTGVLVGYNRIPIDQNVLNDMRHFGFEVEHAQKSIEANRHNSVTTSYYLLLKKQLKEGIQSDADINSATFDAGLLVPQKRRERLKTLPAEAGSIVDWK